MGTRTDDENPGKPLVSECDVSRHDIEEHQDAGHGHQDEGADGQGRGASAERNACARFAWGQFQFGLLGELSGSSPPSTKYTLSCPPSAGDTIAPIYPPGRISTHSPASRP